MHSPTGSTTIHRLQNTLFALVLLLTTGCGKYGVRAVSPNDWDETLISEKEEEKPMRFSPSDKGATHVEQEGSVLDVRLFRLCTVERKEVVDRTGTREYELEKPLGSALYLVAGLAMLGGSAALAIHGYNTQVANADLDENDSDKDKHLQYYVYSGLVGAAGAGVTGLSLGTFFNALQSETVDERITRTIKEEPRPCKTKPSFASYDVSLVASRSVRPRSVRLGRTDRTGTLVVDLSEKIPTSWLTPGREVRQADVRVKGRTAKVIDVGNLSPKVAERAWERLAKQRKKCETELRDWSCRSIKRYRLQYPNSPRADEARALIEGQANRMEEKAWKDAKIEACEKPKKSTDCRGVKRYLQKYEPKKVHHRRRARHRTPPLDNERTRARIKRSKKVLKKVSSKLDRLAKREDAIAEREERVREQREAREELLAIQSRKRECLRDCRQELNSCRRSCVGLSSAAICKRSCRRNFISCEFDCAREERGARQSAQPRRGRSQITVRIGGNKPKTACGRCRAAWRRQCPQNHSVCDQVVSNNCANACN